MRCISVVKMFFDKGAIEMEEKGYVYVLPSIRWAVQSLVIVGLYHISMFMWGAWANIKDEDRITQATINAALEGALIGPDVEIAPRRKK